MEPLEKIARAAIAYDAGDPRRIHHLLKVHAFARLIGLGEGLDPRTLFRLEAAAYLHDIGIHEGERRYGHCTGKIQEELGPDIAQPILADAGITGEDAERIKWLIGHHHTYASIDGLDAQILAEADMLVNPYEDGDNRQQDEALYQRLYKTETGKKLFEELYLKDR
jgi:HD superfamily phosphodiesterase